MLKIRAVAVIQGENRRIAMGCCFDEVMGVVAAAMLRPTNIPFIRTPKSWEEYEAPFGLTREQYEELLA
jgi:hypothetical protein